MQSKCMIILIYAVVFINCTKIDARISIKCNNSHGSLAQVFLMEKDFSGTRLEWLDEDDTLDYGTYDFTKLPRQFLFLSGSDIEALGLFPYIYVWHDCGKGFEWKGTTVTLDHSVRLDKLYHVTIDLDTNDASFTSKTLIFNRPIN